jgi:hypothetical protein
MNKREFLITFEGATLADANRYSEDLRGQLLMKNESVTVERRRDDNTTMDFGATLGVILAAPATIAFAKALIAWAKRNNRARIKVVTKDGVLVAEDLESKDAAAVLKAFSQA